MFTFATIKESISLIYWSNIYPLCHVSDWMVSLNLRGRRRSAVRNGRLLTLLPLNQEPSSFCCSQRKLLTLDRKITQEKTKRFCRFFFWIPIFQRVFLYLQLCISFALFGFVVVVVFFGFPFYFLYRNKERTGLLSVSVCVLCRGFIDTAEIDCG